MMVSGNWESYPKAEVSFSQPEGAGWHVSHIHVYPPRLADDPARNLRINTYNFTAWPNMLPGDELHVPVDYIPVEVIRVADSSRRMLTTWPGGLGNDDGTKDGAEISASNERYIISIVLDEEPSAVVGLRPVSVDDDRFIWRIFFTYREKDSMNIIPQPAGWQIPQWNEAQWTKTANPAQGETRYKLVDARIADNPGDHTIYVEVINTQNERDTEAQVHFVNANGAVTILGAEKPLDEPMCNIPLYKDDTYKVFIGNENASDIVSSLHSRYDDHPELGTTWGHVPYLLQFQQVVGDEQQPTPEETLEQFVLRKSWDAVGVNYNPDAAFTKYATWKVLGKPETNEYDLAYNGKSYRVQAFTLGIVYAEIDDWSNIKHLRW